MAFRVAADVDSLGDSCTLCTHKILELCFDPSVTSEDQVRRHSEKFHQLLAVGQWFPPGTPVSSTR